MKRSLSSREWRAIVGLSVLALAPLGVLCVHVRLPPTWRVAIWRENGRKQGCRNNLHLLSLAMQSYLQDNDGRLPLATVGGPTVIGWPSLSLTRGAPPKTRPVGWADAIMPYYRSESLLMCPAETGGTNALFPSKPRYTDYWINGKLSGQSKSHLTFPVSTLLLGEGNDGYDISDAAYRKIKLPSSWFTQENSPAQRHLGGANYLMADGAVHWLRREDVTTFGGRNDVFALK